MRLKFMSFFSFFELMLVFVCAFFFSQSLSRSFSLSLALSFFLSFPVYLTTVLPSSLFFLSSFLFYPEINLSLSLFILSFLSINLSLFFFFVLFTFYSLIQHGYRYIQNAAVALSLFFFFFLSSFLWDLKFSY